MKRIDFLVLTIIFFALIVYGIMVINFNVVITCPILKYFGFYCPACGITRMFLSIMELHFYEAFRYNPYAFILSFFLFLYKIVDISYFINKRRWIKLNRSIYVFLFISLIVYTVLRNIL